jgi:hypothetical protein
MASIHLDLPDSELLATGQSADECAREAKLLLALKLSEVGRLSATVQSLPPTIEVRPSSWPLRRPE